MKRSKAITGLVELSEALVSDTSDIFLLFADLIGSTEYKHFLVSQGLPDIIWIQRQLLFLQRTATIINKCGGNVVKTIGDEVFAYFDAGSDPFSILDCATQINKAFENLKAYSGKSKIEAKVSVDFGSTYNGSIDSKIKFDPIGVSVDRCARLNSKANCSEILLSNSFYEILVLKKPETEINKMYSCTKTQENLKGLGNTIYYCIKT
jgi:class 3 adenylate cyclase